MRLDGCGFRFHADGLGQRARHELEIDLAVVGDVQGDVGTGGRLEALELDGYGVAANRQLADAVDAIRVGDGGAREAGVGAGDRDGGARNDGLTLDR